jgi:beta-glucanase (GH16 family)
VLTNDSGFGNNEKEYYTPRPTNVRLEDGNLVITAQKEKFTGPDGQTREYTSGRLETHGHFDFTYGRVEARLKMPHGQGIWPAFWMLGSNFKHVPWPACGEIDTMENVGFEPSMVHGSLHGPGYFGGNPLSGTYTLPDGGKFSDDFHVFAVEWEPNEIRFYVDDKLFETQTAASVPPGGKWVFDHKHFIILNVAVGGYWPGQPDATTEFPTQMLVDYVRVYKPTHKANTKH